MKNLFLNGVEDPQNSGSAIELTAKMFFGEGHSPYFLHEEWIDYGKTLRIKEYEDLHKLISSMGQGLRMNGNPERRLDAGQRLYAFHSFYKARASVGCKVILEGGIEKFINDYQEGSITIKFTLEDLVNEAKAELAKNH